MSLVLAMTGALLLGGFEGLETNLVAKGNYVRPTDEVTFELEIKAIGDAEVPAGWLSGQSWEVFLDGRTAGLLGGKAAEEAGTVHLKTGTKLHLSLPVDIGGLLKTRGRTVEPGKVLDLGLSLPGLEDTRASIKVVGAVEESMVPKLDLAKTKVALDTNFGTMVVAFRPDKAPKTVENFVKLAAKGFYDGTKFHRVIPGFMIQGGDPNTKNDDPADDGLGGPGYSIKAEFNDLKHVRGVLSMARSQDPDSAGSQFFICHARAQHLDNQYTAFGKLESGFDALDRICKVPLERSPGGEMSRPSKPVVLLRAIVIPVFK